MPSSEAGSAPTLSVSDFVAVFNQTLELAYPDVVIVVELANFRISKNRWVYFDLKDEFSSIKFFGTVYQLPGPLEDGLMLQVRAVPRLHPQFGFSLTVQSIQPVGEGSLLKAAALLEVKLKAEGLFDDSRKRALPYPPASIGLIASSESAAYADFIKIINQRWGGIDIELGDVQVQGEAAPGQIVAAIEYFNQQAKPPEILIITRGGGSTEDLAAFNTEPVTRAVAASRIPTIVAIGHEVDISLAELAADKRASTPSNAAELLVPDKRHETERLQTLGQNLGQALSSFISDGRNNLNQQVLQLNQFIVQYIENKKLFIGAKNDLLLALSPAATLNRGYAIIKQGDKAISSVSKLAKGAEIGIQMADGKAGATITSVDK